MSSRWTRRGREGPILSLHALPALGVVVSVFGCPSPGSFWRARDRNENKSKIEEKEEMERLERNVINNVMKFLRRVETRRRHLRRDFMKSLNSPARKDIIKFPTAKFAFPLAAHLFVPSSSGFANISALQPSPSPYPASSGL